MRQFLKQKRLLDLVTKVYHLLSRLSFISLNMTFIFNRRLLIFVNRGIYLPFLLQYEIAMENVVLLLYDIKHNRLLFLIHLFT